MGGERERERRKRGRDSEDEEERDYKRSKRDDRDDRDRHHRSSSHRDYDKERDREKDRRDKRDREDKYDKDRRNDKDRSDRDKRDKEREKDRERREKERDSGKKEENENKEKEVDISQLLPQIDLASIAASISSAKEELQKKLTTEILKSKQESEAAKTSSQLAEEALARARKNIGSTTKKLFAPSIVLDEQGRDISENLIPSMRTTKNNIKEFKINRKLDRKPFLIVEPEEVETDPSKNKLYDPRLGVPKANKRDKRNFQFVKPGSYVREAQTIRAQIWSNLRIEPGQRTLEGHLFEALHAEDVPPVEWWDEPFLHDIDSSYSFDFSQDPFFKKEEITIYIEHPTAERPPAELPEPLPKAGFLTKKEQKKLKRMKRAEVLKDKQLKIMMGLEKEPPPRATLTNMIRVYGAEAFQDPTKVDQMVRQQMQERLEKHIKANLERKLDPKERKIKKLEKLRKMDTLTISVAVFKVLNISSPLNRKKIDHNVHDLGLSGVLVICPEGNCNLVVVEGAPRAVRKFKKLMLNRLKWFDTDSMIDDDNINRSNGKEGCYLVWEGEVLKRQFKKFRFLDIGTPNEAKEYLEKRNAVHYWDLAFHFSEKLVE